MITKKKKKISLPKMLAKTQKIFNAYIRERDKDLGCISCGGRVDHAGHYFSQGAHSALRFNELNTHGQCVGCNNFKSGNLIYYRMGLIKRIGEMGLKELELIAQNERLKKWSVFELQEIINKYSL